MRLQAMILCLISAAVLLNPTRCLAGDCQESLEIISEFTYQFGPGDSREKYVALGVFGAKFKAVALSAKYLTHKGLLENYGKKQKEILCLAANEIETDFLERKLGENGTSFYLKIRAHVNITHFIKAEIKNLELEKEERHLSWREEMEQHVASSVDPAQELSRVYRYFRKKQWRIAIIYLDHLEKKYPNWQEIYFAKAIGFYATNKKENMMRALRTACARGSREACEEIEGFRNHENSLNIYRD